MTSVWMNYPRKAWFVSPDMLSSQQSLRGLRASCQVSATACQTIVLIVRNWSRPGAFPLLSAQAVFYLWYNCQFPFLSSHPSSFSIFSSAYHPASDSWDQTASVMNEGEGDALAHACSSWDGTCSPGTLVTAAPRLLDYGKADEERRVLFLTQNFEMLD